MAAQRITNPKRPKNSPPPATTPEAYERQMISLAHDLARRQLEDGSASSQVVTHFLKLGSSREVLEQERLRAENDLLGAKREALQAAKRVEELYADALRAMREYSGSAQQEDAHDD